MRVEPGDLAGAGCGAFSGVFEGVNADGWDAAVLGVESVGIEGVDGLSFSGGNGGDVGCEDMAFIVVEGIRPLFAGGLRGRAIGVSARRDERDGALAATEDRALTVGSGVEVVKTGGGESVARRSVARLARASDCVLSQTNICRRCGRRIPMLKLSAITRIAAKAMIARLLPNNPRINSLTAQPT
jgi:hypothetical protein